MTKDWTDIIVSTHTLRAETNQRIWNLIQPSPAILSQPKRPLKGKIPMEHVVIDSDNCAFHFYFINNKLRYQYLGAVTNQT